MQSGYEPAQSVDEPAQLGCEPAHPCSEEACCTPLRRCEKWLYCKLFSQRRNGEAALLLDPYAQVRSPTAQVGSLTVQVGPPTAQVHPQTAQVGLPAVRSSRMRWSRTRFPRRSASDRAVEPFTYPCPCACGPGRSRPPPDAGSSSPGCRACAWPRRSDRSGSGGWRAAR